MPRCSLRVDIFKLVLQRLWVKGKGLRGAGSSEGLRELVLRADVDQTSGCDWPSILGCSLKEPVKLLRPLSSGQPQNQENHCVST